MIRNKKYNNAGIVGSGKCAYSYSVGTTSISWDDVASGTFSFGYGETDYVSVGGYRIIPDGESDNICSEIKTLIDNNSMASGLLSRKTNINYGQGPYLYKKELINGAWQKTPIEDKAIEKWLNTWKERGAKQSFEDYLLSQMVDFSAREMIYSKVFLNRAGRVGGNRQIAFLEHLNAHEAKPEAPENENVRRIINANFLEQKFETVKAYPVFSDVEPFKHNVSVYWTGLKGFASKYVFSPSWYSAKRWIELASSMPRLLQAYTNNSMSPKYHVIIPQSYVDAAEEDLKRQALAGSIPYDVSMLNDFLDDTLDQLAKVLSGIDNVGKFFSSRKFKDQFGEDKWEIIPIDQKVKDFIEAHLDIYKSSQFANTNAFQVPTALSNISTDGNLSSGSEILYSLKLYLTTSTEIPEKLVTDALNTAIRINFPYATEQRIGVGFYHNVVNSEQNVAPNDRVVNNV